MITPESIEDAARKCVQPKSGDWSGATFSEIALGKRIVATIREREALAVEGLLRFKYTEDDPMAFIIDAAHILAEAERIRKGE